MAIAAAPAAPAPAPAPAPAASEEVTNNADDDELLSELGQLLAAGDMTQEEFDDAVADLRGAAGDDDGHGRSTAGGEDGEEAVEAPADEGDLAEQLDDGDLDLRVEMQALLDEGLMTQEEFDEAVGALSSTTGRAEVAHVGDGGGLVDSSSSDDEELATATNAKVHSNVSVAAGGGEGEEDEGDLVADLRALKAAGEISQEEFDAALADMGVAE